MLFFTAAGEHHVLFAQLDLLHGIADAMGAGSTGRRDRVVDTLDLERRGQAGGNGAAHGARHAVWTNAFDAFLAQDVHGLHLVEGGRAAGACNQTYAWVGDFFRAEPRILDRLLH